MGDPIPPKPTQRIRLGSLHEIRAELARVYRDARARRLPMEDATKLTYILVHLARVTDQATVEAEMCEMEDALRKGAPNGLEHKA